MRHAPSEALEIEAQAVLVIEQPTGDLVECEATRRLLFEEAFAHQMPQHPVQRSLNVQRSITPS